MRETLAVNKLQGVPVKKKNKKNIPPAPKPSFKTRVRSEILTLWHVDGKKLQADSRGGRRRRGDAGRFQLATGCFYFPPIRWIAALAVMIDGINVASGDGKIRWWTVFEIRMHWDLTFSFIFFFQIVATVQQSNSNWETFLTMTDFRVELIYYSQDIV